MVRLPNGIFAIFCCILLLEQLCEIVWIKKSTKCRYSVMHILSVRLGDQVLSVGIRCVCIYNLLYNRHILYYTYIYTILVCVGIKWCSNDGFQIKERTLTTSLVRRAYIYNLISFREASRSCVFFLLIFCFFFNLYNFYRQSVQSHFSITSFLSNTLGYVCLYMFHKLFFHTLKMNTN